MPKIYHVWLIKKPSGLCLVDATINELPLGDITDGMLVAGLFSSYFSFSQKLFQENMVSFKTESFKIQFLVEKGFYIAILADKIAPKKVLVRITEHFKKIILNEFPEVLEKEFDGNTEIYDKITQLLNQISELKGIKLVKYIRTKNKQKNMMDKLKKIQESLKEL